ncbi:MAG TPA: metal-sensitive transcriptional regulator [Turneriella sp.]|nr:metal-sensitive transcriptional regulator [Turneriella sp.]
MVYNKLISDERINLVKRLNRISGQLEGLKKRVAAGESNCMSDMTQIKAIRNALWKFAEAYVEAHIAECTSQKKSPKEIKQNLESVIQAAFSL